MTCSRLAARNRDAKEYLRWVTASQGDTTSIITVDQICYFRADNKYTMVITPDREALIRPTDQGSGRCRRSERVLADPSLDPGQHQLRSPA